MSAHLCFDCFVCLCIYDLVFLFCCLFVYFCDLVFSLLLVFFCFAGTARLSQYSHISLLANKEIRRQHLWVSNQPSSNCKQFVKLARCETVMTTRAEFHFSWVYTFSATPRSSADLSNPSTERDRLRPSTPCATVLIIQQLLPTYMQHHELKLDSNKANLTVEGHRLDNRPVLSMPWRPCTNLCFF